MLSKLCLLLVCCLMFAMIAAVGAPAIANASKNMRGSTQKVAATNKVEVANSCDGIDDDCDVINAGFGELTIDLESTKTTRSTHGRHERIFSVADDCDGTPYNNTRAVNGFRAETFDTNMAYKPSGIELEGAVCGTALSFDGPPVIGDDTRYKRVDILAAKGVKVTDTSTLTVGTYAGTIRTSHIWRISPSAVVFAILPPYLASTLTVDRPTATGCPAAAVACLKASNPLGEFAVWATRDTNGNYTWTIGPLSSPLWIPAANNPAGTTYFKIRLCRNYGINTMTGRDSQCGPMGAPPVRINGDPSMPNCNNGNGWYRATATMINGLTTPQTAQASSCVRWLGKRKAKPHGPPPPL